MCGCRSEAARCGLGDHPYLCKRDSERAASINVTAEAERFILPNEHRSVGADWRSEQYPVLLKGETVRTVSNRRLGNVPLRSSVVEPLPRAETALRRLSNAHKEAESVSVHGLSDGKPSR
jgi:hypothetical protein